MIFFALGCLLNAFIVMSALGYNDWDDWVFLNLVAAGVLGWMWKKEADKPRRGDN